MRIVCVLTQQSDNVIMINNDTNKRKGMRKLLNTMREFNIYDSVEDYADLMLDSLEQI